MSQPVDQQQKPAQSKTALKEWKDTQSILSALLRAWKNYSLYPATHANCQAALDGFYKQIEAYLNLYGRLRFEFDKGRLLYKGESILAEPREEGNLTYNLFRDGIQWLQFKKGLEKEEVKQFLGILHKYRVLADEPDGDLVTDLWSIPFLHIQYQVVDLFWGKEPDIEFVTTPRFESNVSEAARKESPADRDQISMFALSSDAMQISHKEYEHLAQMVYLEEARDPAPDFIGAMMDCLLQYKQKENFVLILDALAAEFHDSLIRKDFDITQKILKSLQYVNVCTRSGNPWVRPAIEKFFASSASPDTFQLLQASLDELEDHQLQKIKEVFLLFQPAAIESLGKMMLQATSFKVHQMLMDVIFSLASQDYQAIAVLLNRPEGEFVRKLVRGLGQIKGEAPLQLLFKMVHHSAFIVRQEAVHCLLKQDPENIQKFYYLINDADKKMRRLILNYMGQEKSRASEDFLINCLEQEKFRVSHESDLIKCYKTLGQCGEQRALVFLKEILLGRGGMKGLLKLMDRRGAAIALKTMGTTESLAIIEAATHSYYPNIRYVARQIMKGEPIKKESSLDK